MSISHCSGCLFWHPLSLNRLHSDLRPAAVRRPHSASTPSSLVATNIVDNLALIAHCQRISQSNRPPHHAHSTIRPNFPSPVNRDLLDDGLTCSLLLSPTMIRLNPSPSPKFPATSLDLVPFLCATVFPLFRHPPSSYLPKTVRPTAMCWASSSQRPARPATTSARCFQKYHSVCIYRAWSLFLILSTCYSIVHSEGVCTHPFTRCSTFNAFIGLAV